MLRGQVPLLDFHRIMYKYRLYKGSTPLIVLSASKKTEKFVLEFADEGLKYLAPEALSIGLLETVTTANVHKLYVLPKKSTTPWNDAKKFVQKLFCNQKNKGIFLVQKTSIKGTIQ